MCLYFVQLRIAKVKQTTTNGIDSTFILSVSYYSILIVQLMLQGNEAEGADTLFEGKGTKNNRDFQNTKEDFPIGDWKKILSCYSSSAPNSLAISSDFLICSIKTLREGSSVMYWATLIPALSSWRSSICSPSTRRRHCQIELYS